MTHSALLAHAHPRTSEFTLSNGMQVVVIPETRAPVVTHMVWYRIGGSDEPRGKSGIAHFLEHLMFKSTDKLPGGEFSKVVARLGGQDNAFTGNDATSYHQRVAKDRLKSMMEMEADRMVNLRLTEQEVLTERDVILEERRSRVDNSPSAILDEHMDAVLYINHPYRIPVIGWEHEIAQLTREDALAFYKRHYAPNNALLVVAGDVTAEEVKALAEETYGKIPANPEVLPVRVRPSDPPHLTPRRVELKDARAGKASVQRYYVVPSYVTSGKSGDAEALDLLVNAAFSGPTSRLYKKLVVEQKIASSIGGYYSGSGLDSGKIAIHAIAADGVDLAKLEAAMDAVIDDVVRNGITPAEFERARNSQLAAFIYESDNQATLARRYGWAMVVGRSREDVEAGPDAIAKLTAEQVQAAARKHLDLRASVTGLMIPIQAEAVGHRATPAGGAPKSRS